MTKKEVIAASKVIKSGILSQYVGDKARVLWVVNMLKNLKKCCSFLNQNTQ